MTKTLLATAAASSLLAMIAAPANAAIRCNGAYQVIKGHGEIATPYCGDNYLAQVARSSYGYRVSNRAVRQNPYLKEKLCLHFGHDIRVSDICAGLRQEDYDDGSR